jgi:hypothetical protein
MKCCEPVDSGLVPTKIQRAHSRVRNSRPIGTEKCLNMRVAQMRDARVSC